MNAHVNPSQSLRGVRECVTRYADGVVGDITQQDLEGKQETLVLFRTRAEVLEASSCLGTVQHRVRMAGTPQCIHPWLGVLFWDFFDDRLAEAQFSERWAKRVLPLFPLLDSERAWSALRYSAGHDGVVRMEELRGRLSRGAIPLGFMVPELGFRGPILGTIHASKGREAEHVHLMLPAESDNEAAGEARVTFVGATRAQRVLRVGTGKRFRAQKLPSGRLYMRARNDYRARIEIGRASDVDVLAQAGRDRWRPASAGMSQELLRLSAASGRAATLFADRNDQFRYSISCESSDSFGQAVGHAAMGLNQDLFAIARHLWAGESLRPPDYISNVLFMGARTIVPTADQRDVLVEPFNRSGFLLAPIISALATVPFFKY